MKICTLCEINEATKVFTVKSVIRQYLEVCTECYTDCKLTEGEEVA